MKKHMGTRVLACAAASAILLNVGALQAGAEVWYEPHDTRPGSVFSAVGSNASIPLATPRWTIDYGRPSSDEDSWSDDRIVAAGSHAYYIQNGKLVAAELSGGRRAWTSGSDVVSIASADGAVYTLSKTGALSRISAATGGSLWRTQIDDAAGAGRLVAEPGAVYVTSAGGLIAVDASTGHRLWRNTDASGYGTPVPLKGMVLYATAESGAITVDVAYAIDKNTGKTLWRAGGVPLQVRDDVVYLRDTYPVGDSEEYGLKLNVVATDTGADLGSRYFLPLPEGRDRLTGGAGVAAIDGDDLLAVGYDGKLYRTHLDAEPTNVAVLEEDVRDFAGPYDGKLFFVDGDAIGLYARSLSEASRTDYYGVDNPVGRLDFGGNLMFVGQTDGDLLVFDVSSGKALARYETGAKHFGPIRVVGDTLLAQTEETLYAFDLPKQAQRKPGAVLTPVRPKAEATLRIDGALQRFEPSPVMIDNRMFVPLRALFQAVGATVDFDAATGDVRVTYDERSFTIREGAPFAIVGDRQQPMSYAPTFVNAAVYVPLRDVGGLLGIDVEWIDDTRTVDIATSRSSFAKSTKAEAELCTLYSLARF